MASQRIIILGSGASLSSVERDNTSLVFETPGGLLLIDCAANPYRQLLKAGLDPSRLFAVFLTHQHPDHIYGLPSLVHHFIMSKRTASLTLYANFPTLRTSTIVLNAFGLQAPFLRFQKVPEDKNHVLLDTEEFTLVTTPVRHIVPTLALRITSKLNGTSVAYSADTGPCPEMVALARGVDILIHESSVSRPARGHTTASQAAQLAQRCEAKKLVLVHLWPTMEPEKIQQEAAEHFKGEIVIAHDFTELVLSA